MKKIVLAAFSASALLGLSACGDDAAEPDAVETTAPEVVETPPMVSETPVMAETPVAE
jgi:hypothetical protein